MEDILSKFVSANKYTVNANSQVLNKQNKPIKKAQLIGEIIEYVQTKKILVDINLLLNHIDEFISNSANKLACQNSLINIKKITDVNTANAYLIRNSYFFFEGAAPDKLRWCKRYADGTWGLDLYFYQENKYLLRNHTLETLSYYFQEFKLKTQRSETINRRAIEYIAEQREFIHKIWSEKTIEENGKKYANIWPAPHWWRHLNGEMYANEEQPWCDVQLNCPTKIIEALLTHTLEDDLQIRIAIKWLSSSCSVKRNRKALCIFGTSRTGKSLITEVLLQILHGQNYDYCTVEDLFDDKFESGTLKYKTAIAFPEIEVLHYLKQFLDFISSENFKVRTKHVQRGNLAEKHLNITINANNLVGEEVFKKTEQRIMERVIILTSTVKQLIGATVVMKDGSEFKITKEDIMRLVNAAQGNTPQAIGDQIKIAAYIHERSKADLHLDLDSDEISGYIKPAEGYKAIFSGLDYWQEYMLEKFTDCLRKKLKENPDINSGETFYSFDMFDLQHIITEMKMNQDCRDSLLLQTKRKDLKRATIINFFKESNQKYFKVRKNNDLYTFFILKTFCQYLLEEAFDAGVK